MNNYCYAELAGSFSSNGQSRRSIIGRAVIQSRDVASIRAEEGASRNVFSGAVIWPRLPQADKMPNQLQTYYTCI